MLGYCPSGNALNNVLDNELGKTYITNPYPELVIADNIKDLRFELDSRQDNSSIDDRLARIYRELRIYNKMYNSSYIVEQTNNRFLKWRKL